MDRKPMLIVMSGLPGTGKSTIAEQLARQLGLPVFSVDPIESAILKAGVVKSFETGLAAYLVAEELANQQLRLANSAIIDAVNAEEEGKDLWRALTKRYDAKMIVLHIITRDRALHKSRIESRIRCLHGFSEVTWDKVEAREKLVTPWREPILQIDSGRDLEANVADAVRYIQAASS